MNWWQEATYVGVENMFTQSGKNNANIGQFGGYFLAGAGGNLVQYFTKKGLKDLKTSNGLQLGFSSVLGDMTTNFLNYGFTNGFKKVEDNNIIGKFFDAKVMLKSIIKIGAFNGGYKAGKNMFEQIRNSIAGF